MSASKSLYCRFALISGISVLLCGLANAADVTVYNKAPSVEELQRQLTGDGTKKPRTRAIVFGDSAPAPQESAPAPQADYRQQAQAAPAPRAQAAPAHQQTVQVGENAIAFPINFRVNSSEILPGAVPFLESIAGLMRKDAGLRLMVEGHTDSSGNPARNSSLSRERAYSVVNYLIERYRIEQSRLIPVGKGFSEPLEGTDASNPKNRRVQFRIVG